MSYVLVTLFLYLDHFIPASLSRPLVVLPLIGLGMLLMIRSDEVPQMLLMTALLFMLIGRFPGVPAVSTENSSVTAIHGRAVQDSMIRNDRHYGFRIVMDAVMDKEGSLFSASGSVFVISDGAEVYYGDEITVYGSFSGPVFYSHAVRHTEERTELSELRASMVSWIRERMRNAGEAGELGLRLLTGYGEMGVFPLTASATGAGLAHVLALSGMHLSILASFLSVILSPFQERTRKRFINVFLFLFTYLSAWRPSLFRAFVFRYVYASVRDRDTAFMLSALILFALFPYSVSDLGAVYSFISLAGIFLLSEPLERGLSLLLPLPRSLSASISASASALLFSAPLTLSVFGYYQTGAVLTSFPASLIISLYMVMTVLALFLPFLTPLLSLLYDITEHVFRLASSFPSSPDVIPYLLLLVSVILLIAIDILYRLFSGHVESELQQHQ